MDSPKSIAVPVTRRLGTSKPKRAGHPSPPANNQVSGSVGDPRRQPRATDSRPTHRYRVGQRLTMTNGGREIARVSSTCLVVALLPHESGPFLYRVRSEMESFERVVDETDLAPMLGRP